MMAFTHIENRNRSSRIWKQREPQKKKFVPRNDNSQMVAGNGGNIIYSERKKRETKMGDLYALDFDGVLCDSCGESSLSVVKVAKVRWLNLFESVDSPLEAWIVDQMYIQ